MKKIFLILVLVHSLFANDMNIASSIFNTITTALTQKTHPKIYIHTKVEALKNDSKSMLIVSNCQDADIVILSEIKNIPNECNQKLLFGTRYSHLKDKRVIGAFFWQKGRPNILFYKKRLNLHNIKLDSSFDKYIE